jgi:hypothetical protein
MEIALLLSMAHDRKSPGRSRIPNYWFKAMAADQMHKKSNTLVEKLEKIPIG